MTLAKPSALRLCALCRRVLTWRASRSTHRWKCSCRRCMVSACAVMSAAAWGAQKREDMHTIGRSQSLNSAGCKPGVPQRLPLSAFFCPPPAVAVNDRQLRWAGHLAALMQAAAIAKRAASAAEAEAAAAAAAAAARLAAIAGPGAGAPGTPRRPGHVAAAAVGSTPASPPTRPSPTAAAAAAQGVARPQAKALGVFGRVWDFLVDEAAYLESAEGGISGSCCGAWAAMHGCAWAGCEPAVDFYFGTSSQNCALTSQAATPTLQACRPPQPASSLAAPWRQQRTRPEPAPGSRGRRPRPPRPHCRLCPCTPSCKSFWSSCMWL